MKNNKKKKRKKVKFFFVTLREQKSADEALKRRVKELTGQVDVLLAVNAQLEKKIFRLQNGSAEKDQPDTVPDGTQASVSC